MSDPWFKFYPTDWRSDPALRMCSLAARGVWIDLICLMHEATPYGHLLVNGRCPTDAQLAVLLGTSPEQLSEIIGELEQAGVFSRTKESVIYSRKMTRMAKKAATARKNGRLGGNPKLSKERTNSASDNLQDNGRDKTQKLEARSQNKSVANATDADGVNFTREVFDRGVAFLGRFGTSERKARSIIGMWRSGSGDSETFNAMREANQLGVTDPVAWITKRLQPKSNGQPDLDAIFKDLQMQGTTQ